MHEVSVISRVVIKLFTFFCFDLCDKTAWNLKMMQKRKGDMYCRWKVDVSRRQTIRRQATTIHAVCVSANQGTRMFLELETNRNKHLTGKTKVTSCLHDELSPVIGTAVADEDQHWCKFGLIPTSLSQKPRHRWSNQQLLPPPPPVAFRNAVPWLWTSGLRSI